jgi:hypothetical protein
VKAWLQGKLLIACLIERLIALGEYFSPVEDSEHEKEGSAAPMLLA